MGYSANVYRTAKAKIEERRDKAEREAEQRKREVYSAVPRIEELENSLSKFGIITARAVLKGENVAEEMTKLRQKNLSMQREIADLLSKNGYPSDYLEPHYFCKLCNDTGFVEKNGKTVKCRCYKNALVSTACEELNRNAPLSLCTFDSFSLEHYSHEVDKAYNISPYSMMSKILSFCLDYAKNFSENSGSILMSGATGLGKTHLSLAIANEVIRRGYGVIYVSAPMLISKLERVFFSKYEDEYDSYVDMLLNCDLLIIDDLGTEFQRQFSTTQIYNTFNSRMLKRKPIIINTNLNMRELEEKYSERFVSRICGEATKLNFLGTDIRIKKKI